MRFKFIKNEDMLKQAPKYYNKNNFCGKQKWTLKLKIPLIRDSCSEYLV